MVYVHFGAFPFAVLLAFLHFLEDAFEYGCELLLQSAVSLHANNMP